MVQKLLFLFVLTFVFNGAFAQLVTVQADYNALGDCIFSAINNAKVPMFLHINFADLENTTFNERLPYVKRLTSGYNNLFTLQRDIDADVPRFNYEIKTFRSNPTADVDLDFPYLIPFKEGSNVQVFDVKDIDGFWGKKSLDSWYAVGFIAKPGENVFAGRNGIVVEIVGDERTGDSRLWYHTWTNSLTLLQPDGSLIYYHNIGCNKKEISVGQMVYAGEKIGEVISGTKKIEVLVFHDSLYTKQLTFVIPQFVIDADGKINILNSSASYQVFHPEMIRGLEMTKRERKKVLEKK